MHYTFATAKRFIFVPRPDPKESIQVGGLATPFLNGGQCRFGREGIRQIDPRNEYARREGFREQPKGKGSPARTVPGLGEGDSLGGRIEFLAAFFKDRTRPADLAQPSTRKSAAEACVERSDPRWVKAAPGGCCGNGIRGIRTCSRKHSRFRHGIGRGRSNLGTEIDEQGLEGFGSGWTCRTAPAAARTGES